MVADFEEEQLLVKRLRGGDHDAFTFLVGRHHASMVRVARSYVPSDAVAEEIAQETWLIALRGIDDFEGRSSVATWLFRILINRARTAGKNERRTMLVESNENTVASERFDRQGCWSDPPAHWTDRVDDQLVAVDLAGQIHAAIDALPDGQRQVVVLRDVEGMDPASVCDLLELTEANQRVLLHRGRARIRQLIENQMRGDV